MFTIASELSVGQSVWSAPRFLETLNFRRTTSVKSNAVLIRRSWHQSRQMAILLVLIKSGSAADSDQPKTLKNLKKKPFYPSVYQTTSETRLQQERFSPRWHLCDDHSSTQTFALSLLWSLKEQLAGIIRWEQNASGHAGCGKGRIR